MTAHPYYTPSNYKPRPHTPTPLSTPEQAAWRLRAWDAQASDDAAHWCVDPYGVGCLSRAAAPARTKQDPWQTYLCPVCIERER